MSVDRRVVAATLAGRLAPVSGRLAVLGVPLPSGASTVMRGVAIAEVAADAPTGGTVGELVARRADATRPWYRLAPSNALVRTWVGRAADAAGHGPDGPRFTADTPLSALGVEARTLVAVAAALAERPKAVVVDLDDDPGASTVRALARARAPRPGLGDRSSSAWARRPPRPTPRRNSPPAASAPSNPSPP